MNILGISCFYHDSSACLLKDGQIIAAAEEERFSRIKHDNSFPEKAVEFCFSKGGISAEELDYVGFYEKPFLKFERVLSQHVQMFPRSYLTFVKSLPSWVNKKLRVIKFIRKKLKFKGDVLFLEHHLAHAASAFLVSPFQKAAILTVDGVGEWTTTSFGYGENNDIYLLKDIRFPHSLGLLYSTITGYLGFSVNNSEYKVMGLSAYGNLERKTNPYYKKLRQVLDLKEDGSFQLDLSYFAFHYSSHMPSEKLCRILEGPIHKWGGPLTKRHYDIAAAVQMVTEDALINMLNHIHDVTKCDYLVLAGGVALNSVFNGKIIRKTPFKRVWIQPCAGDGGTSIGAAAYIYFTLFKNKREKFLNSAYLGPDYSQQEIKEFLDCEGVRYQTFFGDEELVEKVAGLIHENHVVGWFQGRMEWGPRALGARSILSNPCNKDMQAILNQKVKHREKFRPFAPVVCAEDAEKYFECDFPLPETTDYMLMVYPIRESFRELLPAVTHVDGSGRLQTIKREQNPLYYDVIKAFGKLSGIPILINTSFNIRGEPIVCTPEDAYRCMMGTEIDYLIMGNYLIRRGDNPLHMWDSEKYAHD